MAPGGRGDAVVARGVLLRLDGRDPREGVCCLHELASIVRAGALEPKWLWNVNINLGCSDEDTQVELTTN